MIRNIWAVGRNYAEHAKELGNDVPSEPLIFLKAGSCAVFTPQIPWPSWTKELHHEIELALEFGQDLQFSRAALALDLTDRAAQNRLKAKGQPWTLAKSFLGACPLSATLPWAQIATEKELGLSLKVNGELRQEGLISQMIFPPEVLRQYVLKHFPVVPGDFLLTGTPAGVGPLHPGDQLEAQLLNSARKPVLQVNWACSAAPSEG